MTRESGNAPKSMRRGTAGLQQRTCPGRIAEPIRRSARRAPRRERGFVVRVNARIRAGRQRCAWSWAPAASGASCLGARRPQRSEDGAVLRRNLRGQPLRLHCSTSRRARPRASVHDDVCVIKRESSDTRS
jgi:hypothetical protein